MSVEIRKAKAGDAQFIASLIDEGHKKGHYDNPMPPNILARAINGERMNVQRVGLWQNAVFSIDASIIEDADKPVGFIIVKSPEIPAANDSYSNYELWMCSVAASAANRGHGTALVTHVLNAYPDVGMLARCKAKSTFMISILQKHGFVRDPNYGGSFQTFIR